MTFDPKEEAKKMILYYAEVTVQPGQGQENGFGEIYFPEQQQAAFIGLPQDWDYQEYLWLI